MYLGESARMKHRASTAESERPTPTKRHRVAAQSSRAAVPLCAALANTMLLRGHCVLPARARRDKRCILMRSTLVSAECGRHCRKVACAPRREKLLYYNYFRLSRANDNANLSSKENAARAPRKQHQRNCARESKGLFSLGHFKLYRFFVSWQTVLRRTKSTFWSKDTFQTWDLEHFQNDNFNKTDCCFIQVVVYIYWEQSVIGLKNIHFFCPLLKSGFGFKTIYFFKQNLYFYKRNLIFYYNCTFLRYKNNFLFL